MTKAEQQRLDMRGTAARVFALEALDAFNRTLNHTQLATSMAQQMVGLFPFMMFSPVGFLALCSRTSQNHAPTAPATTRPHNAPGVRA